MPMTAMTLVRSVRHLSLPHWRQPQKDYPNFYFICDHCITHKEVDEHAILADRVTGIDFKLDALSKEITTIKNLLSNPASVRRNDNPVVIPPNIVSTPKELPSLEPD